jgi:hypothetical protein
MRTEEVLFRLSHVIFPEVVVSGVDLWAANIDMLNLPQYTRIPRKFLSSLSSKSFT